MAVGVRVDMGNGLQRLQNAFNAARRQLRRVAHSQQWRSELRLRLLLSRLKRASRRLLGWLRSGLRRFTDHPRFQSLLDKFVLLPTLSLLFLLLMLSAVMSGGRRLIHRLTGQNKMRNN